MDVRARLHRRRFAVVPHVTEHVNRRKMILDVARRCRITDRDLHAVVRQVAAEIRPTSLVTIIFRRLEQVPAAENLFNVKLL